MAHTMRGSRNTSQSSSDDCYLGSSKLHARLGGIGRQELVYEPLDKLVEKNEGMEDWFLHIKVRRIDVCRSGNRAKERKRREERLSFLSYLELVE
jgi:hypothetical protein